MLDIPIELILMISTHLEHRDLQALATSSHFLCCLLLPEYLRRRDLVLKDSSAGWTSVELCDLGGYASLGLWSAARIFHPPMHVYCSIPAQRQEARSAMRFLVRFLQEPSNVCNLQSFHIYLRPDPCLVTSELRQLQHLFCALPLRDLCMSGFCSTSSEDRLASPVTLRTGLSFGSPTLTSLSIHSDYAFTSPVVRSTMGILNNSPIKSLEIRMVSLNPSQWSTLLGELKMTFLEEVDLGGDISRPALIRFLTKHRELKRIHIYGTVASGRTPPSRLRQQHFFPRLRTLRAPLAVCCDIVERVGDTSNLFGVEVEVGQLHLFDPLFLRLGEILWRFQKVDRLGVRVGSCPLSVTSQESPNDRDWDEHPACRLRQVRSLSFVNVLDKLSPGDIVCSHLLSPIFFILFNFNLQNAMCTLVQILPMLEAVHAIEGRDGVGAELVQSLCEAKPTLRTINVKSGPLHFGWTADGCRGNKQL